MTPAEAFEITPEERARLEAAPFRGTDEDGWQKFASAVHEQVMAAYEAGEMDLHRVLEVMHSCSLGCRLTDRITLMALTAERALRLTPTPRKRPKNPAWVRSSAAALVLMLLEARPGEPLAPNEMNGWRTPILEDAISWLVTLRLCKSITARTLYDWYLEARDAGLLEDASA